MDCNMEWNVICRTCMQEGQMHSIFEKDENHMYIYEKIMLCSSVKIQRGMNLPEQICSTCLEELNTAYHFRNNCESSDVVLQSFLQGTTADVVIPSENGNIYKFVPPKGLDVKRVMKPKEIKIEPLDDTSDKEFDLNCFDGEETYDAHVENTSENYVIPDIQDSSPENLESKTEIKDETDLDAENMVENEVTVAKENNTFTIKPVKTRKKVFKTITMKDEPLRVYSAEAIHTKDDGTTVIRIRRNANEKKPPKICEICGNGYKYKHALEAHMRRHRNEKPFACEICGRAFVLNVELRCHMRTHTGQKPYACRFCDRRFSDYGSRIKHERTHTGERPYVCSTCGKSFAYSYGLSSHILIHTGEKPYSCELCGKRFTKKHHVKAHMNTHIKNQMKVMRASKIPAIQTDINGTTSGGAATTLLPKNDSKDANTIVTTKPRASGEVSNEQEFIDMITCFTHSDNKSEPENVIEIQSDEEQNDSINVIT